jgi:hypothetical protein
MVKAAYLRKSVALLAWIDSHRPDAEVRWNSEFLGDWRALMPRWMQDGNGIRLELHGSGRRMVFRVLSVHSAPWGARVRIQGLAALMPEMQVIWNDLAPSPDTNPVLIKGVLYWARTRWPGCRILSISRATDRAHTFSGRYCRIRLKHGAGDILLLAGLSQEDDAQAPALLTQALLWLAYLMKKHLLTGAPAVHLLAPAGFSSILVHRCRLIHPEQARIQVWEFQEDACQILAVRPAAAPPLPVEDRDFRWPILGPFRWSSRLARVLDLAPDSIQRYPRFQDYDSLRLLGLEFARVLGPERDRVIFGVGAQQTELTEENFPELQKLVEEILFYRRADSPAVDHPYYRAQSERWLECLLLNEIPFLFPELVPGSAYPQIPVYLGKVPGRVDILGADYAGNLVVMELKVSEDPDMPLQSLDYWGRVVAHNANGDFERRGYFPGIRLSRAYPKIYLVAPIFTYHDSLETLIRFLDPDLEVTKISINEDWRCGVRILRRSNLRYGNAV